MANENDVASCFSLGIKVAEYVHGVRRKGGDGKHDEMFDVIKSVADGDLTLLGTPEELLASFPTPPEGIKLNVDHPVFREWVRNSRDAERKAAQLILQLTGQ